MKMDKSVVFLMVLLLTICGLTKCQETFCGQKEADKTKTCISVRLPWQAAPIYFCTEKDRIPFKNRCTDHLARYCPTETTNTSLLVATPWDCCTLSSSPDICAGRSCPAAPFNRTCKKIAPDTSRPWECCPTYFCESEDVLTCQMKRLEPGCLSPPKGKKNCIAFKDESGCCDKFQCEGDGKPGMCPMHSQAIQFKRMMEMEEQTSPAVRIMATTLRTTSFAPTLRSLINMTTIAPQINASSSATLISQNRTQTPTTIASTLRSASLNPEMRKEMQTSVITSTTTAKTTTSKLQATSVLPQHPPQVMVKSSHRNPITTELRCIGDFNCPGQMKCCSPTMGTYYDNAPRSSMFGNAKDQAVYGYCVEPVE